MHLHGLCETDEARESLRAFQTMWEQKRLREFGGSAAVGRLGMGMGMGYAGGYNASGGGEGSGGGGSIGSGSGSGKVKEKRGVFEKLGLKRKSGL